MSGAAARFIDDRSKGIPIVGSEIERRNFLEDHARRLYWIWEHRTSQPMAWDLLPETHRQAWREVYEFFQSEPECACGTGLMCVDCDRAELRGLLAELPDEDEDEDDEDDPLVVEGQTQCSECGCTDSTPCIDNEGRRCSWVKAGLCDFCADKAKPRVELCSEADLDAVLRALRDQPFAAVVTAAATVRQAVGA